MKKQGYSLSILGLASFNARCFWSWKFMDGSQIPDTCPHTRQLIERTVDYRLHLHLTPEEIKATGKAIVQTLEATANAGKESLAGAA